MAAGVYAALGPFHKDKDVGTTLELFVKYIKRAKMVFATEDITANNKKKSYLQIWGGDDMINLFEDEGKVEDADTFDQAVQKIEAALKGQISDVFPVYKLFCEMRQGKKSFSEWYPQVLEQTKLCNFTGYDYQKAARDVMTMQTENSKIRNYSLVEGPDFGKFVKQGLTFESSTAQAEKIEKSIGEGVNRVQGFNKSWHHYDQSRQQSNRSSSSDTALPICDFCGYEPRKAHKNRKCPAKGKTCHMCKKKHHFSHSKVCPGASAVRHLDDTICEEDMTLMKLQEKFKPLGR